MYNTVGTCASVCAPGLGGFRATVYMWHMSFCHERKRVPCHHSGNDSGWQHCLMCRTGEKMHCNGLETGAYSW
jgi:hypothetical protein